MKPVLVSHLAQSLPMEVEGAVADPFSTQKVAVGDPFATLPRQSLSRPRIAAVGLGGTADSTDAVEVEHSPLFGAGWGKPSPPGGQVSPSPFPSLIKAESPPSRLALQSESPPSRLALARQAQASDLPGRLDAEIAELRDAKRSTVEVDLGSPGRTVGFQGVSFDYKEVTRSARTSPAQTSQTSPGPDPTSPAPSEAFPSLVTPTLVVSNPPSPILDRRAGAGQGKHGRQGIVSPEAFHKQGSLLASRFCHASRPVRGPAQAHPRGEEDPSRPPPPVPVAGAPEVEESLPLHPGLGPRKMFQPPEAVCDFKSTGLRLLPHGSDGAIICIRSVSKLVRLMMCQHEGGDISCAVFTGGRPDAAAGTQGNPVQPRGDRPARGQHPHEPCDFPAGV